MANGGLPGSGTAAVNIDRNVAMGPNTASRITINYPFQFMVLNPVVRMVTPASKTGSSSAAVLA